MQITCVYMAQSRNDPLQKRFDTKGIHFSSRIKLDAENEANLHRIILSSCKREADPEHLQHRTKSDPLPHERGNISNHCFHKMPLNATVSIDSSFHFFILFLIIHNTLLGKIYKESNHMVLIQKMKLLF